MREGKFRKDLYYRINVFLISLPTIKGETRGYTWINSAFSV
ncbi:MAG: hypothetical protein ACLUD0_05600 [Eubacterium ramulus]